MDTVTPAPGVAPDSGTLGRLSIAELADAVRGGALSPPDLIAESLASLDHWQPVTNAASHLWPEEALAEARALRPGPHLPLPGIPVLVKESMDVAGHLSTGCSGAFRDRRASRDAKLVTRLRAAGAIVVGKTNMHELAASATGHVTACGATRNPWDPGRLAGGSSGGSAAAVATRSVPLALGTDTAGSVRIACSFCGVAGLKPAQGRLPTGGIMPLAPSLGCPGPITVSVADLGLVFAVLAGELRAASRMQEPAAGLRVARVPEGYYAQRVHPAMQRALDKVAGALASAGVRVTSAQLPGMEDALATWADIAWPEFAASYPGLELTRVGAQIAGHYLYGKTLPEERKSQARKRALEISASFLTALRHADALLLPCTAYAAPRFCDEEIDVGGGQTMDVFHGGPVWFTCPVNIAGLPALALPAGSDEVGLPLGVQLIGNPSDEWTLLRIGAAFETQAELCHRPE